MTGVQTCALPIFSVYLRHKRSWFVIDKEGFIRYMKVDSNTLVPSDELIQVVKKYNQ